MKTEEAEEIANLTTKEAKRGERTIDASVRSGRRDLQRLIRRGEEHAVTELLGAVVAALGANEHGRDLIAVEAIKGLSKLCNIGEKQKHKVPGQKEKITVESVLLKTLVDGNNRVQAAAAECLGRIGTSIAVQQLEIAAGETDTKTGETYAGDRNASVRSRARIALRQLRLRCGKSLLSNRSRSYTSEELDAMISTALNDDRTKITTAENNVYRVEVKLRATNRSQTVLLSASNKFVPRSTATPNEGIAYLYMYTVCGPATEEAKETALKLNGLPTSPDLLNKNSLGFIRGSLAVRGENLIMLTTESVNTLSIQGIAEGVHSLALIGDEIERRLTGVDER
ncbi:HEAT repeat domain-containing protein [bacterium]|nr:HEAT repeat domain-containing protein [bacterium]